MFACLKRPRAIIRPAKLNLNILERERSSRANPLCTVNPLQEQRSFFGRERYAGHRQKLYRSAKSPASLLRSI
jgi:hypothetical protein